MEADGVTRLQNGWDTQTNFQTSDGSLCRRDYANLDAKKAVEVKRGSTPTKEGLIQLDKHEKRCGRTGA
ncbi:MAG: hypothetical protein ABI385_16020 [Lapillicoccus sp.]